MHFKGSRATESIDSAEKLMNLRERSQWLSQQFRECESQLSCIIEERYIVANRSLTSLTALRYALDCHKRESNVCGKLDEKINTATLELRDGNLNSEREEYLQVTIETLTEIREELANTKDFERLRNKYQLYKAEFDRLKASNTHVMLYEKMEQITECHSKVVDKIRELMITVKIEEELEDLTLN